MCHSYNGFDSERAISAASSVLPVPGSPLIRSGRDSTIAAFTAAINSSVAIYRSVPRNCGCMLPPLAGLARPLLSDDLQDLHRIGAARHATVLALGEDDQISLHDQLQVQQQAEYREVERLAILVGDIVGDRIHAAIERHAAPGDF